MTSEELWERIQGEFGTLRSEVRGEIGTLQSEIETLRSDTSTRFTHRLDVQASEHQALRFAVERLERRF